MNQNLRKIFIWFAGISVYFLSVAVVLAMFLYEGSTGLEEQSPLSQNANDLVLKTLPEKMEATESLQGVLIPLGPGDGSLPGLPGIWNEFLQATEKPGFAKDASGFDGLQAARNVNDMSQGAVNELFISSQAISAYRIKNTLYVLSSNGRVTLVDCTSPGTPVLVGALPYPSIEKFVLQGTTAYLLLKKAGHINNEMLVLDLSEPGKTQQLAKLTLSGPVVNFFFYDDQLLTYESPGGKKNTQYLNFYDMKEGYQFQHVARIESPILDASAIFLNHFLLTPDLRDGIKVFDLNNPYQPTLVASLPLGGKIGKIVHLGHRLFAEASSGKFFVVDLLDISNPALVNEFDEANYLAYFLDMGDYCYYFSDNGYLRVFNTPLSHVSRLNNRALKPVNGTLLETVDKNSFFSLDRNLGLRTDEAGPSAALVTAEIVDTTVWKRYNVLLDKRGNLNFLRRAKDGRLIHVKEITLPGQYRWLAASETHLYAGGSSLAVIGDSTSGEIEHLHSLPVAESETLDGIVVHGTLSIADGKRGVKLFSLSNPARPEARGEVVFPQHLRPLVNARQLAWSGQRLLLAAGSAGLVVVSFEADGQAHFVDALKLPAPLSALTVVNGFCLASDKQVVHVVDFRNKGSLQRLGEVSFAGVERFAVANNGLWGGYVPGEGWRLLPDPSIVTSAELSELLKDDAFSDDQVARYRLHLFDENNVIGVPGIFSFAALSNYDLPGVDDATN